MFMVKFFKLSLDIVKAGLIAKNPNPYTLRRETSLIPTPSGIESLHVRSRKERKTAPHSMEMAL